MDKSSHFHTRMVIYHQHSRIGNSTDGGWCLELAGMVLSVDTNLLWPDGIEKRNK
ncbi:hypothetical protein [Methylophaga nitratireducenticrescens]|uniref:Uncharacterized protein n=1 Tax=Methylophaga nitratireducenticrescens TaxID=754476 RepID=I1XF68_METNJ|nr:hypothetical protein [Methylophaga nitratireducenticrescens]